MNLFSLCNGDTRIHNLSGVGEKHYTGQTVRNGGFNMVTLRYTSIMVYTLGCLMGMVGCTSAPPSAQTSASVDEQSAPPVSTATDQAPSPPPTPVEPIAVPSQSAPELPAPVVVTPPVPPPPPATVVKPTAAPKKPSDPNTFLVTAGTKDATHPSFGQGHMLGFAVNGEQGKTLALTRGETYTFEIDTGVQHDFYFSTSPVGWGSGVFADGIKGQFTYQGSVTFKPGSTTPDALFYQCRNHKNMGGKVLVINKGEVVKIEKSAPVKPVTGTPTVGKPTAQQVQQKLSYAEMLVKTSESAKRIQASNNVEAKNLQKQAQEQIVKAKAAGADLAAATVAVDEAFRLNGLAVKLVPAGTVTVDYKSDYEHIHKEMKGYELSYNKNRKNKDTKVAAKLDEPKYKSLVSQAEQAAASGDYAAAIKPLKEASNLITAAISVMLDDATVVYELKFDTPKDEYEYELERYKSYTELVPIAKQELKINAAQNAMVDELVNKAEQIIGEGKARAAKGEFPSAIQAAQAATENVKRALVGIGVK